MYNTFGIGGYELFEEFKIELETRYQRLVEPIKLLPINGRIIRSEGTTNIHPKWSPDGKSFIYLSNKKMIILVKPVYILMLRLQRKRKIKSGVSSAAAWHSNGNIIYYSKKPKYPNKNGSKFYDLYSYDIILKKKKDLQMIVAPSIQYLLKRTAQ